MGFSWVTLHSGQKNVTAPSGLLSSPLRRAPIISMAMEHFGQGSIGGPDGFNDSPRKSGPRLVGVGRGAGGLSERSRRRAKMAPGHLQSLAIFTRIQREKARASRMVHTLVARCPPDKFRCDCNSAALQNKSPALLPGICAPNGQAQTHPGRGHGYEAGVSEALSCSRVIRYDCKAWRELGSIAALLLGIVEGCVGCPDKIARL